MHVCIVEAGQQQFASRVDHLGVRATPRIDVGARADRDDAVPKNRDCLCQGHGLVYGPDFGVGDDEIGSWFGLSSVPRWEQSAEDNNSKKKAVSSFHESALETVAERKLHHSWFR